MKKILVFLVVSLFITFNTCLANISQDEVALGGIKLGATPEYVKSVYGEPSSYINLPNNGIIYNYNDTFKIYFANLKYFWIIKCIIYIYGGLIQIPKRYWSISDSKKHGRSKNKNKKRTISKLPFWEQGRILNLFSICSLHNC